MDQPHDFTVEDARQLAARAHAGQVDKLGRDYFEAHLVPIAALLRARSAHAEMAGLLHDVLEDTSLTQDDLRSAGVPEPVISAVVAVTRRAGEEYDALVARSAADPLGKYVKLADNTHNLESNTSLAAIDPDQAMRLRRKYERARSTLLSAVERDLSRDSRR